MSIRPPRGESETYTLNMLLGNIQAIGIFVYWKAVRSNLVQR